MVNIMKVAKYENFRRTLEQLTSAGDAANQINMFFSAKKNQHGVSWCPTCNRSYPFIMDAVKNYARKDSIFMEVDIGRYPSWKRDDNPWMKDPDVPITVIPSLVRFRSELRLVLNECEDPEQLKKFFTAP